MPTPTIFKFRLYVADHALNSVQAMANLRAICQRHLPDRHEIDIVDVFRHSRQALEDGIFLTPTLVKIGPAPTCTIVGTLSQTALVLQALGLDATAP